MSKSIATVFVALVVMEAPPHAFAEDDLLLSGFVAPIFNVRTSTTSTWTFPAESFDNSVGWGVNLASTKYLRRGVGFELDWAWYPNGLETSDQYGTKRAAHLMSLATNVCFSFSRPGVTPYFSFGPTFERLSSHQAAARELPSSWGFGLNGGGGIVAFATGRLAGRVDVRYFGNFTSFYRDPLAQQSYEAGWPYLRFIRLFAGATVVL